MLARTTLRARRIVTPATQARLFSSEDKKDGGAEWGLKYDDECLKFEQEWKEIADKVDAEQAMYLENELSELQRKKVDMIADKVLDMNVFEMRYMALSMKQRMLKTSGINPLKVNMDWPSVKMDSAGTWPPANPNWFKQQDLMASLGPFMGQMGMGMGGGGGGQQQAAAAEEAPAEAEPAEEKTHFDVELTKFDAATKIKVIKEIRGLLGLGLKEAKELVEGAPQWIGKEIKKEEAEAMVEKLKAVGAECKLA